MGLVCVVLYQIVAVVALSVPEVIIQGLVINHKNSDVGEIYACPASGQ